MKACPFCAEQIQDDAIKCRFCGEFLQQGKSHNETTYIQVNWNGKSPELASDGDHVSLTNLLSAAVSAAGYVMVSNDPKGGIIKFETTGMTWHSWAGEEVSVSITDVDKGSLATFHSKGKPSGQFRLSYATNASKYVEAILPFIKVKVT